MENVDAVLNEQNLPEFRRWLAKLTSLGYTNSYKVLNAKDYGVPQNRRRIFVVSMLGGRMLDFPKPCPDGRVLRDVLEDDVDESFYLSEDKVAKYRATIIWRHTVPQRSASNKATVKSLFCRFPPTASEAGNGFAVSNRLSRKRIASGKSFM